MADAFLSNSDGSDFEGFSENDIEIRERHESDQEEIGSDIRVSPVSSPNISDVDLSDEETDDERDDHAAEWSSNLRTYPISAFDDSNVGPTFVELCAYFGIMLVLSIVQVPSFSMAWKTVKYFHVPGIADIMTHQRFEQLSKYFHVNDTRQNPARYQQGHDKLCHVRPVYDAVLQTCKAVYNPPMNQSIEEGMVAFKGRLSFIQYLPAKPTRFGIKVWMRAHPSNGYVHKYHVYIGKPDGGRRREEGLGARVVKDSLPVSLVKITIYMWTIIFPARSCLTICWHKIHTVVEPSA